ncbi:MAG: CocE/NonD family hydrolase [Pseudomonadota bacterium]
MTRYDVEIEHNVAAAMRDGVTLRADIYRPKAEGDFPVLLCRTPYGKTRRGMHGEIGNEMASRGYMVVYQDVRGRYDSEGEPLLHMGSDPRNPCILDGYDTVEWCAALPGSTGKVGTFGNSYCGMTQWEMAPTRPPHLACMFAQGVVANHLDRHMSGVIRLGRRMTWTINTISPDMARRLQVPGAPKTPEEADELWDSRDRSKWLWYLPLSEIPKSAMPGMHDYWQRLLRDTVRDHFAHEARHKDVDVPVLSGTGWYDQQLGTIKQFAGMRKNGMTEAARASQRLIVGPWGHTTLALHRKVGELDFGPAAEWNYYEMADAWFGKWLKGERTEADEWAPAQIFVMGRNDWRHDDQWPPAGMTPTPWYLHSGGGANLNTGDGVLSPMPPADDPPDAYDYDPRDPVMTIYTRDGQQVPMDQRRLDDRRDILRYTSAPLDAPLEVVGPVEVRLFASSSAPDTDFIAKLIDVHPDGFVQELCYGLVRARHRNGTDRTDLIEPGEVYEYTIKLNPTGNCFLPGHRIRLDIQSSDFPNFDRNHNTGGDDYRESTLATARQTVFHDGARPSHVLLPVIPG